MKKFLKKTALLSAVFYSAFEFYNNNMSCFEFIIILLAVLFIDNFKGVKVKIINN